MSFVPESPSREQHRTWGRYTPGAPASSHVGTPESQAPHRVVDPHDFMRRFLALRRRERHLAQLRRGGMLRAARRTLTAPVRTARETYHAVRAYGRATAEDSGISPAQQFLYAWWLNLRYGYASVNVYRYRLFTRARALPVPLFMQVGDTLQLCRLTSALVHPDASRVLADKRRFERWCSDNGFPSAATVLECEGGQITRRVGDELPRADLFAKWGARFGGEGAEHWRFDGERYVGSDGDSRSGEELVALLTARSRDGLVLLQRRLVNHPSIARLSPNALSTIRVMTIQWPGEPPRFQVALLRMGTGMAAADNFAQGGIASVIDPATGTIGPARNLDGKLRTRVYESHPDTRVPLDGFEVPFWRESIALALEAHARLGPIANVGWDVAVLEDGPVLLEGNWNPCLKLVQVATQLPMATTEYAACYDAWLRELEPQIDDECIATTRNWKPSQAAPVPSVANG